jgi:probable rRNA maturation factor
MSAETYAPEIDVIVEAPCWDEVPDAAAIVRRALAQAAATIGADFGNATLAVLLTDDAAIRRLNAQWRDLDKPTNVLSFPAAPQLGGSEATAKSLGDIAIACETTQREARAERKPFAHHLSHLAVHGFLHLLGYDHATDTQAETMEQLERAILQRLGVPDPYLTHGIGV